MTMNTLNFFEIPTQNLERAVAFYQQVFNCQFRMGTSGESKIAMFAAEGVNGALLYHKARQPQSNGTVVYLDAGGDLDGCIARVAAAGGRVVVGKTNLGAPGYVALFHDTEGNTVGMHTPKSASGAPQDKDEINLEDLENVSGGVLGTTATLSSTVGDVNISASGGFEKGTTQYFTGW